MRLNDGQAAFSEYVASNEKKRRGLEKRGSR